MPTPDVLLKRMPESLLIEILRFWEDLSLSEITISRYDKEWKAKTVRYSKGRV